MDGLEVSNSIQVLYCEHGILLHFISETGSAK
jgi:hypothetical protein